MLTIDPNEVPLPKLHGLLQSSVIPRPICLASTIDKDGNINLSPFSFFNLFSSKPPILVFSPARRGRNNTVKHTYENVLEVPEVVINIVNYGMVEQVSLASVEFPKEVNEFAASGLTPVASTKVKPPRVGESPVSFECKVNQVVPLGDHGGAGNLVICEIVLAHFKDEIFDEHGFIDPHRLDAVARLGNNYYARIQGEQIFEVPKPNDKSAIGFGSIPESIRKSAILTGNDLGRLGNVSVLPSPEMIASMKSNPEVIQAIRNGESVHHIAQRLIRRGEVNEAWGVLLGHA